MVAGPPLFRHLKLMEFKVRYADGTPLSFNAKDAETGCWWVKSEGNCQYYFVGTRAELAKYGNTSSVNGEEIHSTTSSQNGGRGRRGGGRGRRGGS